MHSLLADLRYAFRTLARNPPRAAFSAPTRRDGTGAYNGVGAVDPLTFTATPLILGAVALVASWVPARRAARVDPVVALTAQ